MYSIALYNGHRSGWFPQSSRGWHRCHDKSEDPNKVSLIFLFNFPAYLCTIIRNNNNGKSKTEICRNYFSCHFEMNLQEWMCVCNYLQIFDSLVYWISDKVPGNKNLSRSRGCQTWGSAWRGGIPLRTAGRRPDSWRSPHRWAPRARCPHTSYEPGHGCCGFGNGHAHRCAPAS